MKTFTLLKGFLSFTLISFVLINKANSQVTPSANPVHVNRSVSSTSVISASIAGDTFTSATWAGPGSGVTVGATSLSGGNTVASATATFTANGLRTFTLTYTKASTGATVFNVTVDAFAVQLTLSPSTIQNDDQGDFEDFSSNPTGFPAGVYTYSWNVSPNTGVSYINGTSSTDNDPRIQFDAVGSFQVSVIQSRGGVTVTSPSTTVNIVAPSVTISPSTTQNIDAGDFLNFSSTPSNYSGSGAYTYNWQVSPGTGVSFINSTTSASSVPRIQFGSAGAFTVKVTQSRNGFDATSAETTVNVSAATITLSPSITQNIVEGQSKIFTADPGVFGGDGNFDYTWTVTGPGVATISGSNPVNDDASPAPKTITFPSAGTYSVSVTATRDGASATSSITTVKVYVAPSTPNLWATSTSGNRISSFKVTNGAYASGPDDIFDPFPSTAQTTAALGKAIQPTPATGYFYWLPNAGANGVVDIYGANFDGSNITLVGTLDVNGGTNTDLGFVRLGMGPDGTGWILAGDGSSIVYLVKFLSNGLNPIVPVVEDADGVTIIGGLASTFDNGDICVSSNGTLYALANNGSGVTQIFLGTANGNSTTFTKKFDLVDNAGDNFSGSVNGVAFDEVGSLYVSTADGLYYIDATTVNSNLQTVECALVWEGTGLQDLASNIFPVNTPLPVTLLSFSAQLRNNITTLNWETTDEIHFDHYEIERRTDNAAGYTKIGVKASLGSSSRSSYSFDDNLAGIGGNAFNYRLKMVDQDGKFKYSNVVLIRRDQKQLTGIMLSPNPVISGNATARFSASAEGSVNMRIIDMSGKMVLTQLAKVYEGENSISINNLDRLQPGIYLLSMENQGAINTIKFSIAR